MTDTDLEAAFAEHRGRLLALGYRLTGSLEDAEEAVQETFVRALARPPRRLDQPLGPWLMRVATNLSLDALRRRKRRAHPGPWLPWPLLDSEDEALPVGGADPASCYDLREGATLAFLVALESLPPRQRAALVLGEVFELSAREIGRILGVSEGGVRMLLSRARDTLRTVQPERSSSLRELEGETRHALTLLLECLREGDARRLASLLAEDARLLTDSGGRVTALRSAMVGSRRIARLLSRVAARRLPGSRTECVRANGLPALWIEFAVTERRQAPRALLACALDGEGAVSELFVVVDPRKLERVRRSANGAGHTP